MNVKLTITLAHSCYHSHCVSKKTSLRKIFFFQSTQLISSGIIISIQMSQRFCLESFVPFCPIYLQRREEQQNVPGAHLYVTVFPGLSQTFTEVLFVSHPPLSWLNHHNNKFKLHLLSPHLLSTRALWGTVCISLLGLLLLLLLSRFSRVRLCTIPEMAAHQAPPSLGFSRQEHWSGLPFPSPRMLYIFQVRWSRKQ